MIKGELHNIWNLKLLFLLSNRKTSTFPHVDTIQLKRGKKELRMNYKCWFVVDAGLFSVEMFSK